jgi:peptidoglycan/xylan/chitin deacetylase (PgdA/CDA1 family)
MWKMEYLNRYFFIDENFIKNKNLIEDLVLCKREIKLQNAAINDLIFESYGKLLGADEKKIKRTIYEILEVPPKIRFEYPENKKFAVCLTHDVDEIYPPLKHTLLSSFYYMKNLNFNGLKNLLFWKYKGKDYSPYRNFKEIMNLEEKYGAKSSFYFLTTGNDIKRFRYDIEDLKNELGSIVDKGWEVGLHGGYYAYNDLEEMETEKRRLEKVLGKAVIGYRNHYLRFKVPETWDLLAKAGFKYDTTFGYNDMIGFRNGMCHPFKPFNLSTNKEIGILEIPLIIMDGALFDSVKSFEEAWEITKRLIDTVEKYNGVLTLLWHNNVFNCPFREKWKKLYEKILEYSYKKNAWMTSGEEIWRWWEHGYKKT